MERRWRENFAPNAAAPPPCCHHVASPASPPYLPTHLKMGVWRTDANVPRPSSILSAPPFAEGSSFRCSTSDFKMVAWAIEVWPPPPFSVCVCFFKAWIWRTKGPDGNRTKGVLKWRTAQWRMRTAYTAPTLSIWWRRSFGLESMNPSIGKKSALGWRVSGSAPTPTLAALWPSSWLGAGEDWTLGWDWKETCLSEKSAPLLYA